MSSKDKGAGTKGDEEEQYCVTFVPQAWRRHVCKNCFRTRPQHEPKAAPNDGGNGKSGDDAANSVSNMAAKFGQKGSKGDKKGSKANGAAPSAQDSPGAATAEPAATKDKAGKSDSLVSQKKAGNNGGNKGEKDQKGPKGWKKRRGSAEGPSGEGQKGVSLNGKKGGTSTAMSPPSSKRSAMSPPPTGKKLSGAMSPTRPMSPTTSKKDSPMSPTTSKKSFPLSLTTSKKSPENKKDSPMSPTTGKKTSPMSPTTGKKESPMSPSTSKKTSPMSPPSSKKSPLSPSLGKQSAALSPPPGKRGAGPLSPPVGKKAARKGKQDVSNANDNGEGSGPKWQKKVKGKEGGQGESNGSSVKKEAADKKSKDSGDINKPTSDPGKNGEKESGLGDVPPQPPPVPSSTQEGGPGGDETSPGSGITAGTHLGGDEEVEAQVKIVSQVSVEAASGVEGVTVQSADDDALAGGGDEVICEEVGDRTAVEQMEVDVSATVSFSLSMPCDDEQLDQEQQVPEGSIAGTLPPDVVQEGPLEGVPADTSATRGPSPPLSPTLADVAPPGGEQLQQALTTAPSAGGADVSSSVPEGEQLCPLVGQQQKGGLEQEAQGSRANHGEADSLEEDPRGAAPGGVGGQEQEEGKEQQEERVEEGADAVTTTTTATAAAAAAAAAAADTADATEGSEQGPGAEGLTEGGAQAQSSNTQGGSSSSSSSNDDVAHNVATSQVTDSGEATTTSDVPLVAHDDFSSPSADAVIIDDAPQQASPIFSTTVPSAQEEADAVHTVDQISSPPPSAPHPQVVAPGDSCTPDSLETTTPTTDTSDKTEGGLPQTLQKEALPEQAEIQAAGEAPPAHQPPSPGEQPSGGDCQPASREIGASIDEQQEVQQTSSEAETKDVGQTERNLVAEAEVDGQSTSGVTECSFYDSLSVAAGAISVSDETKGKGDDTQVTDTQVTDIQVTDSNKAAAIGEELPSVAESGEETAATLTAEVTETAGEVTGGTEVTGEFEVTGEVAVSKATVEITGDNTGKVEVTADTAVTEGTEPQVYTDTLDITGLVETTEQTIQKEETKAGSEVTDISTEGAAHPQEVSHTQTALSPKLLGSAQVEGDSFLGETTTALLTTAAEFKGQTQEEFNSLSTGAIKKESSPQEEVGKTAQSSSEPLSTEVQFYIGAGVSVDVGDGDQSGVGISSVTTTPVLTPSQPLEEPDSGKPTPEGDNGAPVSTVVTTEARTGGGQEDLSPPGEAGSQLTGVTPGLPVSTPEGTTNQHTDQVLVAQGEQELRSSPGQEYNPGGPESAIGEQLSGLPLDLNLPDGYTSSADFIVLECPAEISTNTQEGLLRGSHHQEAVLSPVHRSTTQSPEEPEQWFETETDISPPAAFSDTSAPFRVEQEESFLNPTLGGSSEAVPVPGAAGGGGGGGDIGSHQLPLGGQTPGGQEGAEFLLQGRNREEGWPSGSAGEERQGEQAVTSAPGGDYQGTAYTTITTPQSEPTFPTTGGSHTGGGLLAIAVPTPSLQAGEYSSYNQLSVGSVGEEGYGSSQAFSPVVVRASSSEQHKEEQLAGTTLTPLRVDVTGGVLQGQTSAPPSASSDATGGAPGAGADWAAGSVVGEQWQATGPGGAVGGGGEAPIPWSSSNSGPTYQPQGEPTDATAPAPPSVPEGGVQAGVSTATPALLTTQPHPASPVQDYTYLPPGGGEAEVTLPSTQVVPSVTFTKQEDTTQAGTFPPAEPSSTAPGDLSQPAEPEVIIECKPVVASTFSPRVSPRISSPTSAGSSPTGRDVKVAAATISLRQPSSKSPVTSLSPPSPRLPASPVSPEASSTEDGQEQTCVSKVASFVIGSAKTPEPDSSSTSSDKRLVDFNHYTVEPSQSLANNNSKYDYDDEALAGGYGGFPADSTPKPSVNTEAWAANNNRNNKDNNDLEEEDITTIATVNVKNKKKVRQRPVHQQLQFDRTFTRSSSVPDNSIFHIASHKPEEDSGFSFDRTLQFGPSGRQRRRRMSDAFAREDAMMEGTRMLIENLREKQHLLEEKCARLEREKAAVGELLSVKKSELHKVEDRSRERINALEMTCSRLDAENCRLLDRLNLPETDRTNFRDQEMELDNLRRKLLEAEEVIGQLTEESACLQHEVKDMHLEMEEMHDQFRDDEALEFRDMQKELEATAKNCRILQFKLRKAERRNDALHSERMHFEEKIRHLENRNSNNSEQHQIRELEEELRMAKEVSVRLHDELEATEDRRSKFQEELERVHDLLLDSEKGRGVLQKEVLTLTEEVEQLREQIGDKLDVPKTRKPTLGKMGSQGSTEVDVEQLMRDLADSLEREHDLKGQLEHAEEDLINFRKKLSDLEDENEVIQIQLQKMSAAKSGKYFQKSVDDTDVVTEAEHELRLQLELAEEEIHVLRRKVDETDMENANMKKEVWRLQLKLAGKDSKEIHDEELEDTRSYDERICAMATDIDELKWRLIQKDQESAQKDGVERDVKDQEVDSHTRGERRPMKLSKSVSLDSGDVPVDSRHQVDTLTSEADILKDRIIELERDKDELKSKNSQIEMKIPSVTADDSVLRNIELQDKIQSLESDNSGLRDTIRSLDERTTALSKEVNKVNKDGGSNESVEMKDQLRRLEADVASFQKTISELQESNIKLTTDLRQYEQTDEGKESKAHRDDLNLDTANKSQLRELIKDQESDLKHLHTVVKNREQENEKLEREISEYRDDMDKMLETFKERETYIQMEIQSWEQKNSVLSNLLELVTERAESIRSEKRSQSQSDRSASVVSAVSDVTMGSDEVFGDKADLEPDWDEKFLHRIRSLEDLLREERQKVQAVEKRLSLKDGQQSALTDDMKLHEREKEILQQEQKQKQILEQERAVIQEELALCQRQLAETTEQSESLRERLNNMQKVQTTLRQDFQRVTKELHTQKSVSEDFKKKLEAKEAESSKTAKEEEKKTSGAKLVGVGGLKDKEPASWRWEKQEMERTIKDLRKKSDDLHKQLSRQQVRVKMAGDDGGRPRLGRQESIEGDPAKTKELETQIKSLKEDADKRKGDISKLDEQIKELQNTLKSQEEQWDTERDVLEGDRTSVIKELTQKGEVLKAKDEIIKQKDSLLKQKETALKERENSMMTHDLTLKEKDDALAKLQEQHNEVVEQLNKLREEVKQREESQREMELKIKELNAAVCARDGRIKEKDDILENLNRLLSEKESNISDMDNTIRQAMKSMDDKETEIKKLLSELETLRGEVESQRVELTNSKNKSDDFERNLHKTEKEHGKEIASLVILREKMEAHIQQLNTEKTLAEGEIQDIKRVMMEKEDFWRSCRNELENELRKTSEKLNALESAKSGNQSETIMKLSVEKDDLTNEKNILVKEVKRLAREFENAEMEWQQERRKFSHSISSKEDEVSQLTSKPWQSDITERLTRQGSIPEASQQGAASSSTEAADHQMEILRKAERASLEELYENKLRIAREQLRHAQGELEQYRREVTESRELLMASQKSLSEVKHKYDVTVTTWHDEKSTLERRALESDDRRREVDALQRVVEQLESQLRQLGAERDELDSRIKKVQADSNSEMLHLQGQVNKYEEQTAMTSSGKFKWSEKQKRETAWGKERSDQQRAITEYQNLVRDLEVRVRTAERTRDRDQKELLNKLDSSRRTMDRENNDLRKSCTQMEEKSKQVAGLQKTLIDLQYKLQSDREVWLRERSELQRQLSDAEKAKLEEKKKFTELLSEVKRVKELTPLLVKSGGGVELEIQRKRKPDAPLSPSGVSPQHSPCHYDMSPGSQLENQGGELVRTIPIRRLVDDALQRISQLAEDLNKTDIKRSSRPTAPPAFRRSLSTSEVEEYREYAQQQEEEETHSYATDSQSSLFASTSTISPLSSKPPAPPGDSSTAEDKSRSSFRRAFPDFNASTSGSGSGTGRASRPGSARNSMYASGTQSAYSSRDASPERRLGVRKITPYPVAPPSFLITPSRTPRRVTASMDREIAMPEKHLQKLYDKLSAIEQEQNVEDQKKQDRYQREGSIEAHTEAIDSRRKSGMRMLVKSMSVDSYREDPNWMPSEAERDPNAHFCPKQLDTVFDDAPKSQTLPASVRVGEHTFIPGNNNVATEYRESRLEAFSKRRQSQDARKTFYEDYPLYSSGFFSWPRKSRRDRDQEEKMATLAADEEAQEKKAQQQQQQQQQQQMNAAEIKATAAEVAAVAPQQQQPEGPKKIHVGKDKKKKKEKEEKEKKESKMSYFFSSVKERRNMFMKKSRSVDESPIRKSVMTAGLQAGRAAAPSTFETPAEVKESPTTTSTTSQSSASSTSRPVTLRQKFHKRAASLDVTSLFSVSSSGTSGEHGSSSGASSTTPVTSSTSSGSGAGSGSKDQSRDGTYRVADFEVPPSSPTLTPNFRRVRAQSGRRPPSRWRTPSMEKASERPLIFRDINTDRIKVVVKRRSLSESNIVFLEHMQSVKVWNFSETEV